MLIKNQAQKVEELNYHTIEQKPLLKHANFDLNQMIIIQLESTDFLLSILNKEVYNDGKEIDCIFGFRALTIGFLIFYCTS